MAEAPFRRHVVYSRCYNWQAGISYKLPGIIIIGFLCHLDSGLTWAIGRLVDYVSVVETALFDGGKKVPPRTKCVCVCVCVCVCLCVCVCVCVCV